MMGKQLCRRWRKGQDTMTWHRGQAYGQDLRDRVLAAAGPAAAVAERFGVSASYVTKARLRLQRLGSAAPGAQRCHVPRTPSGAHERALTAQVRRANDQTLAQLCAWLACEHGVTVSCATLCKTLARLGLPLKKRRSPRPSSSALA